MQTKDEPQRGRSPGYSTEIAETICHRVAGGESLRAICADPAMPARAQCSAGSTATRNFDAGTLWRTIVWLKT